MKEKTELFEELANIIYEHLLIGKNIISIDTNIKDELDKDLLTKDEFFMTIEEEFYIEIPDEISEYFETVEDVYDYLVEHSEAAKILIN